MASKNARGKFPREERRTLWRVPERTSRLLEFVPQGRERFGIDRTNGLGPSFCKCEFSANMGIRVCPIKEIYSNDRTFNWSIKVINSWIIRIRFNRDCLIIIEKFFFIEFWEASRFESWVNSYFCLLLFDELRITFTSVEKFART